jgi:glutamate 5-kinase
MRLIVKVGTQVMVTARGFINTQLLGTLALWMADKIAQKHQIVLVTSGAVGLGKPWLLKTSPENAITFKQAAAAIGQPLLMGMYQQLLSVYQQPVAQVLLSGSDFSHRERYLNVKASLELLLSNHILPIVNENDVISTAALAEDTQTRAFSDNDHLSAILAAKLKADVLLILTNVNGVYTANPADDAAAVRIPEITDLNQLDHYQVTGQSAMGRGGMRSKLMAAKLAAMSGVNTWIAPITANLDDCLAYGVKATGTWIPALPDRLTARDQWIGYGSGFNGVLVINDGAKLALLQSGASLLSVGITQVDGQFMANQVVSIQDQQGNELGRGLCRIGSDTLQQWITQASVPKGVELVHRNNMVLYERYD